MILGSQTSQRQRLLSRNPSEHLMIKPLSFEVWHNKLDATHVINLSKVLSEEQNGVVSMTHTALVSMLGDVLKPHHR